MSEKPLMPEDISKVILPKDVSDKLVSYINKKLHGGDILTNKTYRVYIKIHEITKSCGVNMPNVLLLELIKQLYGSGWDVKIENINESDFRGDYTTATIAFYSKKVIF